MGYRGKGRERADQADWAGFCMIYDGHIGLSDGDGDGVLRVMIN